MGDAFSPVNGGLGFGVARLLLGRIRLVVIGRGYASDPERIGEETGIAFALLAPYPPKISSAFRITGSRWASTSSPFSTPKAWLKISVLRRLPMKSRATDHSPTLGWIARSERNTRNSSRI
jgi:hypothetical protein